MPTRAANGDTAAHHLCREVPRARPDETAGAVRKRLRAQPHAPWDVVCLTDVHDRLVGMVTAQALLLLPAERPLADAALKDLPHVLPDTDQERVASLALHHDLPAVPVIDRTGRLHGVVNAAGLLRILREEHVEDLHRLAGIARETRRAREAIDAPPLRRARHRLPWLVVGLLGSIVATWVMSRFEHVLAARPAIAFFVPALVYLADAIGTQSEAVAVRGLSLSHSGLARLLGGELRTGLLIGTGLALVTLPLVWFAFGDLQLALAVAGALAGASTVATSIGILFPWLLGHVGLDPAYGSGPLATIIQDVLTLLVYFGAMSALVL
jgi:magnesium transporter